MELTYRRRLNNGSSFNNLFLMHLGTGTVKITDNRRHTSLVAQRGRQVNRLFRVILREAVDR